MPGLSRAPQTQMDIMLSQSTRFAFQSPNWSPHCTYPLSAHYRSGWFARLDDPTAPARSGFHSASLWLGGLIRKEVRVRSKHSILDLTEKMKTIPGPARRLGVGMWHYA